MKVFARAVMAGFLLLLAVDSSSLAAPLPDGSQGMLPTDVVPTHYDLSLVPDAEALTFTGKVGAAIDVKAATSNVVLNAVGLTFDHVALDGNRSATVTLDPARGRATLHFATPLATGSHRLDIAYHGKIGRSTLGFFAMDYATPAGKRRTLATNFEPAYARRLLPCWDQPDRKATFSVTVDIPGDRVAVSNMPVAHTVQLSPITQRVNFATTPKMSTYLLFLAIGDFERVHRSVDGVDVGVVVKRGDAAKASHALDQAVGLLHFYDNYFGVHYPLPKLDLVAAPGQITGGSMENWGAIFFSQNHVLLDEATATERERQLVFLVVAHEMSHQWFGDLVTMRWWDNLWLNEGFARWMQTYAADALHPEWQTGLKAQSIFESGKQVDAAVSTHPVLQPVLDAAQAEQAFDAITYNKGAAVITMLTGYIGDRDFRAGVRRYMQAHAFGNTVDTDLWSIMQQVAGKPILQIEHDFTQQPGLPLVRVASAGGGIRLSEDRFHDDPDLAKTPSAQRWSLPLAIAAPGGTPHTVLLRDPVTVSIPTPTIVNAGQTAYARVLYPQPMFEALLAHVPSLQPVDQIGLLNDGAALGMAGYAPASNALAVAARLPVDADPVVWMRVVALLEDLDRRYADTPQRAAFRSFARKLLQPVAVRVGRAVVRGEPSSMPILRAAVLEALGDFGDADVIRWARQLVAKGSGPPADGHTALVIAAVNATPASFDKLLARARAEDDPLAKQQLYVALAGVRDPALAQRLISLALTGAMPAGSNVHILADVAELHPDLAWKAVVPHLADPDAGVDEVTQWGLVAMIASGSADLALAPDVETYAARRVPPGSRRPFGGAVSAIHQNHRIATQVLPEIDHWVATASRSGI